MTGPAGTEEPPRGAGAARARGAVGEPEASAAGPALRVLRAGRRALLVEAGSGERVAALHAELLRRRAAGELPGVEEIVPAARTVLLDGVTDPDRLAAELPRWRPAPPEPGEGPLVELGVRFDGPDLPEVARLWGMSPEAAARVVTGTGFRVAFCGFAPGFGYLDGLPAELAVPRRATPRTSVPAGSVALAGGYAGVYPRSSPGGWQLIGSTDAVLWDPDREPAALFAPGTRVRFRADTGTAPATDAGADTVAGAEATGGADAGTEGAR